MSKSKSKSKKNQKRPEKIPAVLYHYTSAHHYGVIQDTGCLKLTPSNLLPPDMATACQRPVYRVLEGTEEAPKHVEIYGYEYWDKNCDYKKVVWLTDDPNATTEGICVQPEKLVIRLSIDTTGLPCRKWRRFADENHMDLAWRRQLEAGRKPGSWFVCTSSIPLSKIVAVDVIQKSAKSADTLNMYAPLQKRDERTSAFHLGRKPQRVKKACQLLGKFQGKARPA